MTFLKILLLVSAIVLFFKTPAGDKISNFLPTPFWIYFLSIVAGTVGFLPHESPVYPWMGLYCLSTALLLMLVGTPITHLIKMGPKAFTAMLWAIVSMLLATFISYAALLKWLPEEGWKAAGALLGTWIGGSANMLAVKGILNLSDHGYAPLIIVDTIFSYSWMALLIAGAAYQNKVDGYLGVVASEGHHGESGVRHPRVPFRQSKSSTGQPRTLLSLFVNLGEGGDPGLKHDFKTRFSVWIPAFAGMTRCVFIGGLFSWGLVFLARQMAAHFPLLSTTAWALLLSSTLAIFLSLTPLQKLETWGASKVGQFLLYMVLVSIGAKTTLAAAMDAPVYFVFGFLILLIHGIMMVGVGRLFKLPLMLLSTASQAAVGGPVSAPLVAEAYQPSFAHIGVLMAILGAVAGTYAGVLGGWACKALGGFLLGGFIR